MQCAAAAATTVGAASGLRAWLGPRLATLTRRRRAAVSVGIGTLAVLAAGLGLGAA